SGARPGAARAGTRRAAARWGGGVVARVILAWVVRGWTRRRAANVGTLILALANAIISYDALASAARDAGLPWLLSWLFPLATDGIIAVATPAQLELRERNASG